MKWWAELSIDQATLDTDLFDLCYSVLSPRVVNYLKRQGVGTVRDLVLLHKRLGRPSAGRAMRRDISEFLASWEIREADRTVIS